MMKKAKKSEKLDSFLPSPRRRAREFAVQALYQVELTQNSTIEVAKNIKEHIENEKQKVIDELKSNIAQIRAIQENTIAAQSEIHTQESEQLVHDHHQLMDKLDKDLKQTMVKLNSIQQSVYDLFEQLFFGASEHRRDYLDLMRPYLDREADALNPIERSILLMATHELSAMPETPYAVIINEAIELTKTFGGVDSHKFVNGILDKLVAVLRPHDAKRSSFQAA